MKHPRGSTLATIHPLHIILTVAIWALVTWPLISDKDHQGYCEDTYPCQ